MLAKGTEKGRGHKQRSSEPRINLRGCGSAEFGSLLVAVSRRVVNRVRQRGSAWSRRRRSSLVHGTQCPVSNTSANYDLPESIAPGRKAHGPGIRDEYRD